LLSVYRKNGCCLYPSPAWPTTAPTLSFDCYSDAEYFDGAANMRRVTMVFVRLVREVDLQAAGSRNRRLGNLDHAVVFGQ
jgi:hypothetical protein